MVGRGAMFSCTTHAHLCMQTLASVTQGNVMNVAFSLTDVQGTATFTLSVSGVTETVSGYSMSQARVGRGGVSRTLALVK